MNGCFQIVNTDNGTGLRLIPPKDGGTPIDIKEVRDYLSGKGIPFELIQLNKAAAALKDSPIVLQLQKKRSLPQPEMIQIQTAPDKMTAVMRVYPPSTDGSKADKDDIYRSLKDYGVIYGIQEEVIEKFLHHRKYCENIEVAIGSLPIQGTDAAIKYYFNTDLHAKPTLNEDGSVDFFNLNTVNHCKKGDILARLIPEIAGMPGKNVMGEVLLPREVKKTKLQYGRNITLSEEKDTLTADVNGHVTLVENKVFVSDIYEVENVDNATGNIDYEGSIVVNGNVCSNFSVKAKGNIEVKGVVEGAYLEAGGDIIIARGVNGMTKGILKAEGNIIAKFIENASAFAGGYVESGSILHSRVSARTEVNVNGRKGFITGGVVSATSLVQVKTLGSPMGASTIIEVGVDPAVKKQYQDTQKKLMDAEKTIQTVQPVLLATSQKVKRGLQLNPAQMAQMKGMVQLEKQKKEELEECTKIMEELHLLMESGNTAKVIVTGEVFPGTKIAISDVSMVVQDNLKYCKFIKLDGDVKMTGI